MGVRLRRGSMNTVLLLNASPSASLHFQSLSRWKVGYCFVLPRVRNWPTHFEPRPRNRPERLSLFLFEPPDVFLCRAINNFAYGQATVKARPPDSFDCLIRQIAAKLPPSLFLCLSFRHVHLVYLECDNPHLRTHPVVRAGHALTSASCVP